MFAGCGGDRGDTRFGGEVFFAGEAGAIVAELAEDLGGVDAADSRERGERSGVGVSCDGVFDRGGELLDLVHEGLDDVGEGTYGLAFGFCFEFVSRRRWSIPQSLQQLTRGAAAAVGMSGEEGSHPFFTKPVGMCGCGVLGQESKSDGAVDVREDGRRTGPEALEQSAQLIGQRDTLRYQVIANADESAQGSGFIAERAQGSEAVAVRTQDVGQEIGIAGIAFSCSRLVARPASLDHIWVYGEHGMASVHQRIYEHTRGALYGDGKLGWTSQTTQLDEELLQASGGVWDFEASTHAAVLFDHADRVFLGRPIQPTKKRHSKPPVIRVRVEPVGRSCRSLIVRRSVLFQAAGATPCGRSGPPDSVEDAGLTLAVERQATQAFLDEAGGS
jgi:hypothetical protein